MYKINGFLLSDELTTATNGEVVLSLTNQEKEALKLFFATDDGFVDIATLESVVWGARVVTQNSPRKLISGLRLKFGDNDSFKNVRGKGYQLTFELIEQPAKVSKKRIYQTLFYFIVAIILALFIISILTYTKKNSPPIPKVSVQKVFESSNYVLDYAAYKDALYVTTHDKSSSKLYKTLHRKNEIVLSADFPGAYRGIEIHFTGRTILHVIEDSECKIKVFERPVESLLDEIPCNRQNAFPSFDWIDETKFYITYNVDPSSSIRPFIYDLETKRLEVSTEANFDSHNGRKFIDAFLKSSENGFFTLREDYLDHMSLVYFQGDKQRVIYEYRAKPYSIGVAKNSLFFIGNNNELLKLDIHNDVFSQDITPSLFLAPQTIKIDDPLVLDDELYFSIGNTSTESIYSTSGNFTHSLENGVRDFTYTDEVLSIFALTNSGYVIEQLRKGIAFKKIYIDTKLNLRHVAFYNGKLYLAGASGVYELIDSKLLQVSSLRIIELVSNGKCMIIEAENGIFNYSNKSKKFDKLATQGGRPFPSQQGCLFVDNLSNSIVNEKRRAIGKPLMEKYLFEHQGRVVHWSNEGDETHIIDVETGEIIDKIKSRVLYKRVISYGDDILYLGHSDVSASIHKVKI